VEQIGNWEFRVSDNGSSQRLVVVAYKDDVDAPDLAFYTSLRLPTVSRGVAGFRYGARAVRPDKTMEPTR
jgi:hypothetical protein